MSTEDAAEPVVEIRIVAGVQPSAREPISARERELEAQIDRVYAERFGSA
ncbi:hypothetical protein [Demequina sp. NBRC 110054]|nr:hypothetical protein [Demequina sp. NBRC 110054]